VTFEEITVVSRGGAHHGWPFREGADGQDASSCAGSTPTAGACVDPAFSYPHDERPAQGQASVTGGVFSSHCAWPAAYRGRYWFGDYNKGRVWTLTPNAARDGVVGARTTVVSGAAGPVHFLEGRDASIYFLGVNDGSIWRIVPRAPEACPEPDAGVHPDAASPDAASPDAESPDAGRAGGDAAEPVPMTDASETDAAILDAGLADAATADAGTEPAEGGGCGCRAGPARPETILGMLALLGLAALRRRR
jgi:MYXO-CTERM domain-containing protein